MVYHIDVGHKHQDRIKDDTVRCKFLLVMSDTNLGILCVNATTDLTKGVGGDICSNLVVDFDNSFSFLN